MLKRRDLMKTAAGTTAAVGLSAFAVENIGSRSGPASAAGQAAGREADAAPYNETYRGRSITIAAMGTEKAAYIDGQQLHLMKIGDDAYLSAMCHYTVAKTPLEAARTAVDELRGAHLLPLGGSHEM